MAPLGDVHYSGGCGQSRVVVVAVATLQLGRLVRVALIQITSPFVEVVYRSRLLNF